MDHFTKLILARSRQATKQNETASEIEQPGHDLLERKRAEDARIHCAQVASENRQLLDELMAYLNATEWQDGKIIHVRVQRGSSKIRQIGAFPIYRYGSPEDGDLLAFLSTEGTLYYATSPDELQGMEVMREMETDPESDMHNTMLMVTLNQVVRWKYLRSMNLVT